MKLFNAYHPSSFPFMTAFTSPGIPNSPVHDAIHTPMKEHRQSEEEKTRFKNLYVQQSSSAEAGRYRNVRTHIYTNLKRAKTFPSFTLCYSKNIGAFPHMKYTYNDYSRIKIVEDRFNIHEYLCEVLHYVKEREKGFCGGSGRRKYIIENNNGGGVAADS